MIKVLMVFLFFLIAFSLIRLIKGPSFWDRLLALNIITSKVVIFLIFLSIEKKLPYLLDMSLAYGILGLWSVIFISQFVSTKGDV